MIKPRGVLNLPEGSVRAIITLTIVWAYLGLLMLGAIGPWLGVDIPTVPTEFNALVMTVVGSYFSLRPPLAIPEHQPRRDDPPVVDPVVSSVEPSHE